MVQVKKDKKPIYSWSCWKNWIPSISLEINIIYTVNTDDPCFILSWSDTTALSHSQILSVKD